jgi:hypothetical protein
MYLEPVKTKMAPEYHIQSTKGCDDSHLFLMGAASLLVRSSGSCVFKSRHLIRVREVIAALIERQDPNTAT